MLFHFAERLCAMHHSIRLPEDNIIARTSTVAGTPLTDHKASRPSPAHLNAIVWVRGDIYLAVNWS